jgi:hypothetical protein
MRSGIAETYMKLSPRLHKERLTSQYSPGGIRFYLKPFCNNIHLNLCTMKIDKTPKPGVAYPRVMEAKGENPEQYPDWDYEE